MGYELPAELILTVSIILSLKTVFMSNLNFISVQKENFVPTTGKIPVVLSSVFSTVGRVGAILLYCGPAMGNFGLLHHWKQEQIPYKSANHSGPYVLGGNLTAVIDNTTKQIPWSSIERNSPPYTDYTGLGLRDLYIIFLIAMVVHIALVFIWKTIASTKFRYKAMC